MRLHTAILVLYAASPVWVSACGRQPDARAGTAGDQHQASKIVVGAEVPDFRLTSLENSEISYTRADVAGKAYLIDFWATWCAPCVAELPNLHRAYETYGDRGFEILSVAMNDNREQIARLRETEWAMPWLHAFEPLDSDIADIFELFGLPMAILVDSSNIIIAVGEDARGEPLQQALVQLFDDAS